MIARNFFAAFARPAVAFLLLAACVTVHAQAPRLTDPNAMLWVSHLGDHKLTDKWSFHTEAHIRRSEFGGGWQQLMLRPAVNYQFRKDVTFTLGYSFYQNYMYGEFPASYASHEHHVWEQVSLSHMIGSRLKVAHRYRYEQRFISRAAEVSDPNPLLRKYSYLNRFRYRLLLTLPVSSKTMEKGTIFLSAYDEMFLNFGVKTRTDWLNQNRAALMVGYQFDKNGSSIQVGYLNQNIERPELNLVEHNHVAHVILTWNLDLRKKEAEPAN